MVGLGNEEQKVIAQVRDYVRSNPLGVPTLVLFFSDGGVYRNKEIEQQLRDGRRGADLLAVRRAGERQVRDPRAVRHLDRPPGGQRRLLQGQGDRQGPDADLYDQLLSEFPQWIRAATAAGILA